MEMQSLERFFTAQQSAAKTTFHRGLNLKKTAGLKSFVGQTERCVEAGRQKGYLESASAYALFNLVTTERRAKLYSNGNVTRLWSAFGSFLHFGLSAKHSCMYVPCSWRAKRNVAYFSGQMPDTAITLQMHK